MKFFEKMSEAPLDPLFGLTNKFLQDPREEKVNLGIGVYKDEQLKPYVLPSVKEAEAKVFACEPNKDYLPIDGERAYVQALEKLIFGEKISCYGAQTVAGTAALRVGAALLKSHGFERIFLSNPTWANHPRIFEHAGFAIETYPYFEGQGLRLDKLCQALDMMPERSVVLLQACCHNPTGCDPTFEEWKQICALVKERNLFPFFDCAYQGFGESIQRDVAPLRHFVQEGVEFALAVSNSKNFGLYAERTGALFFVCASSEIVGSQIKPLIRGLYSNPPCHGARIVTTILEDDYLRGLWEAELGEMRARITQMRKQLVERLPALSFMETQVGMFSYTALSKEQVGRLIQEFAIYLPGSGRINVAGLNEENLSYVTDAISKTLA